jgi:hypothetical protein
MMKFAANNPGPSGQPGATLLQGSMQISVPAGDTEDPLDVGEIALQKVTSTP